MKKGFTIIEVVIATAIFALASAVVSVAFVQTIRTQKRIVLENTLFEDSRFVMERMINLVKGNTIDFEEYYNQLVHSRAVGDLQYGKYYGEYGKLFYNPGSDDEYGALCNDGVTRVPHRGIPPAGCVILQTTVDENTGQTPFLPSPEDQDPGFDNSQYVETASAFCSDGVLGANCDPLMLTEMRRQPQLYLINATGTLKTMLVREKVGNDPEEYALGFVRLEGVDSDDADDIPEDFSCTSDFNCTGGVDAEEGKFPFADDWGEYADGEILANDFVPISPERVTIKDLRFYMSPPDDSFKAFSENTADIQIQPHVTIVMTVALREEFTKQSPGGQGFEITLQTTVSSGVYEEVVSY